MGKTSGLIQAKQQWERSQTGIVGIDPKALEKIRARESLLNFTCHTFPQYQVNWHHQQIASLIDRLVRGCVPRLILSVPPRYGKSELLSRRLPAYLLGLNPDAQIIATSYAANLASRINRDVQKIIDSPPYRELFPQTRLPGKNVKSIEGMATLRNREVFEIIDRGGSYRAAGVDGAITGMGFGSMTKPPDMEFITGLGLIDDPFKNRKEANSKTVRDGVWDWYTSTFRTRAEGDAAILVVATRWHHDDLIGRLIKQSKEDPKADQWEVVKFDAIREADPQPSDPREVGEPLWISKHSLDELIALRASVGESDWASLYQQSPSIEGGNIFNSDWWRYWVLLPKLERVVISLHSKFKEVSASSFVTLQVWGRAGDNYYLLDQVRDRLSFTDAKTAIDDLVTLWASKGVVVHELFIEAKKNGKAIVESLSSDCPVTITATDFNGDTEGGRAQAVTGLFQSGHVFIPPESSALWVGGFKQELEDFPNSESEDQTGALTQALIYLALRQTNRPYEKFNRAVNGLRGQDAIDFGYDSTLDLYLSFDWNRSPACAVAAQVRGNEVFGVKEWYLNNSSTFALSEEVGAWIVGLGHKHSIHVHGDATGRNQTANSTQSNWDIFWSTFKRLGLKHQCRKRYKDANPRESDRVISVNYLFMSERAFIPIEIMPELTIDFENALWDAEGKIDKKKDPKRTHPSDAWGYLCHDLFPYRQQGNEGRKSKQSPIAGLAG